MRGLNNEIKDALTLSDNVPQQFQEFVAFLQWLDNWIRAREAEKKSKLASWNTNTTFRVPSTTHTPSTTTGTYPGPMDLSANQRTLTPEEYQKRILEGWCLYCGDFGHVAWACFNKHPYGCQLHGNEARVTPFQFNVSIAQTAPVVVNTEAVHIAPPFSKLVEYSMFYVLTMAHTWDWHVLIMNFVCLVLL
jgi:hypothetical protein